MALREIAEGKVDVSILKESDHVEDPTLTEDEFRSEEVSPRPIPSLGD
jgi:hypothetical protein